MVQNTLVARDKITFFAFHTFLVEEAKIEPWPNNITAAHAFVIVTLRALLGRSQ